MQVYAASTLAGGRGLAPPMPSLVGTRRGQIGTSTPRASPSQHTRPGMSTQIETSARATRLPRRRAGTAATSANDEIGRALRAAMRAYVLSLGGTPMMYRIGALSLEPVRAGRVRVDGGLESCMVTALFPGVQVRAFSNSPGGWFSQTPTAGYRPEGTSVICATARGGRAAKPAGASTRAALPALL